MIRFCCLKCGREYRLADALARLPLLCKGCGDRLIVPDPGESLPAPLEIPKPNFERSLPIPDDKPDILITPTVDDSEVSLFLSDEMRKKLSVPIEGSGLAPPPAPMPPLPKPPPPAPLPPEAPPEPEPVDDEPSRDPVSWVMDGAAFVLALVLGSFVGTAIAGKSTLRILGDAPAAPKFPPTDLLLWVGSVAVFGLLYVWLGTRGWSLGARFTRRS